MSRELSRRKKADNCLNNLCHNECNAPIAVWELSQHLELHGALLPEAPWEREKVWDEERGFHTI
jgi:hypothetical protein